ncbi:MAG: dihydroneopterin aldolase [Chitinophagaceae bacterium]
MLTIHLSDLQFHGCHGLYKEEKITGGDFLVNVEVEVDEPEELITSLHQSLNYVLVYDIVKKRMTIPTPLLETIAMELAHEIITASSMVKKVTISIVKQAAPIVNFIGKVGVRYVKEREAF